LQFPYKLKKSNMKSDTRYSHIVNNKAKSGKTMESGANRQIAGFCSLPLPCFNRTSSGVCSLKR
jgi:hypothetical protein